MDERVENPDASNPDPARTPPSLLKRIRDSNDRESWSQFVKLYEPYLRRYLMSMRNLPREEAFDIVQETFKIVVAKIGEFEYDRNRSFRAWLCKVASNLAFKYYRAGKHRKPALGGSSNAIRFQELPDEANETDERIEADWQKHLVEQAMLQVKATVKESTWMSFELVYLRHLDRAEAARQLEITKGQVYTNIFRVLERIRKVVEDLDASSS